MLFVVTNGHTKSYKAVGYIIVALIYARVLAFMFDLVTGKLEKLVAVSY